MKNLFKSLLGLNDKPEPKEKKTSRKLGCRVLEKIVTLDGTVIEPGLDKVVRWAGGGSGT
jgi:hypothetical protein